MILARHARRLLHLIDDSPIVPGDQKQPYEHRVEAHQVIADAECDLHTWEFTDEPNIQPIASNGGGKSSIEQADTAGQSTAAPISDDGTGLYDGRSDTALSKEATGGDPSAHLTEKEETAEPVASGANNTDASETT
jgi:hypothetical protein